MPTPTPVLPVANPEQFSQWVQSVNLIIQLGAVGVLLVLAFALLLYIYTTRNRKPANADSQVVITMLSGIVAKQDERQEKSEEANRKLLAEMNVSHIEGMTAIAEGMNKQADNNGLQLSILKEINTHNQQQTVLDLAMRDDLRQMTEKGSVPLQNLILKTDAMKDDTDKIPTIQKQIDDLCKLIESLLQNQADCVDFKKELTEFEQRVLDKIKRDTSTNVSVILPPNVTADDATDDDPPAALPRAS